nr:hypothetical protein [Escherichia sp. E4702]
MFNGAGIYASGRRLTV